jgi:hypothetical protein
MQPYMSYKDAIETVPFRPVNIKPVHHKTCERQ